MIFEAQQHLVNDPIEEGEAMQTTSQDNQGEGSRKLHTLMLTKLAKA
jgi:hypothetical protein